MQGAMKNPLLRAGLVLAAFPILFLSACKHAETPYDPSGGTSAKVKHTKGHKKQEKKDAKMEGVAKPGKKKAPAKPPATPTAKPAATPKDSK